MMKISPNRGFFGPPTIKSPPPLEQSHVASPSAPSASGATKFASVAVADIISSGSYRPLDEEHVADLQESIGRIGLTTPIFLAAGPSGLTLIAGQHRLEAVRRLCWTHIDAIKFDTDDVSNRRVAISENFDRKELTALERADLQTEWLQTFRNEGGQVAQPVGGDQPHDRGISKAARQTGVSPKQFRRAETIAGILPEAKAKARELGLDQKQSALLKIATGKTIDEQLRIATELAEQKRQKPQESEKKAAESALGASEDPLPAVNFVAAPSTMPRSDDIGIPDFLNRRDPVKAFEALVAAWDATPSLKNAWADAPIVARTRFATEVLHVGALIELEANNAN